MRHTLDFSQWGKLEGIKPTHYSTVLAKRMIETMLHTISDPPQDVFHMIPLSNDSEIERGADRSALRYPVSW
jgi:hypothetical protein